jgi:hypothetical protein
MTEAAEDRMAAALHVSNGDATDLAGTGLAHRIVYWRDVLHDGPVPAVATEELRGIRGAFLGNGARETLAERDRELAANRDGDYVLWFEADLYDQLQIIQILDRLAELGVPAERIALICIGEHLDVARFGGLGELTAAQLRELAGIRRPLTPAALELAGRAWAAFRAPDPEGLGDVAATRSLDLRFLGEAFDRLGREYPWRRDGLALTAGRRTRGPRSSGLGPGRSGRTWATPRASPSWTGWRAARRRCSGSTRPARSTGTPACDSPTPGRRCSPVGPTRWRSTGSTGGSAACTSPAGTAAGVGTTARRPSSPASGHH